MWKGGMKELREGTVCVCREGVPVLISMYSAVSLTQVRE